MRKAPRPAGFRSRSGAGATRGQRRSSPADAPISVGSREIHRSSREPELGIANQPIANDSPSHRARRHTERTARSSRALRHRRSRGPSRSRHHELRAKIGSRVRCTRGLERIDQPRLDRAGVKRSRARPDGHEREQGVPPPTARRRRTRAREQQHDEADENDARRPACPRARPWDLEQHGADRVRGVRDENLECRAPREQDSVFTPQMHDAASV